MMRLTRGVVVVLIPFAIASCSVDGADGPTPAAGPAAGQSAAPRGDLDVSLTLHQSAYMHDEAVIADVTITNLTQHNVKLLSWFMPTSELEEPIFVITRGAGRSEFLGPHYKRPHAQAGDFVHVAAGATITGQVDLARFYDFTASGDYAIHLELDVRSLAPTLASSGQVVSNTENVWIEARPAPAPEPIVIESTLGGLTFSGRCSGTQQALIATAVDDAGSYTASARNYLAVMASGTPRYTTWFGTYTTARRDLASNHFTMLADAFATKPINVDCKCKKNYYAYVYPNQPYNIYVCRAFWNAPATGTDSKAGTLVHEMSHFNVVASTDDVTYGQTNCRALAVSDPDQALNNADSHEYFAENTPFLQ